MSEKLNYRLSFFLLILVVFLIINDISAIIVSTGTAKSIFIVGMPLYILLFSMYIQVVYYNYNKLNKLTVDYLAKKFKDNKTAKLLVKLLIPVFVFIVITDVFLFYHTNLLLIFSVIYSIIIAIILLKPLIDSINNKKYNVKQG